MEIASWRILERQKLRCYNWIIEKDPRSIASLTDEQLLLNVKALAGREREATAQLIALLAELDARRLYLGEGFRSLFTYCTQCLLLSEHAAYGRIEAARAARQWPEILELLADGSITLTTVCLLASHLTPDNHQQILEAAKHKSKREVELQIAALHPMPALRSYVRKLPATNPASVAQPVDVAPEPRKAARAVEKGSVATNRVCASAPPSRPAVVAPLAPELYKVQLTISREAHDKLRKVQDLLRHSIPTGDPAAILTRLRGRFIDIDSLECRNIPRYRRGKRAFMTSGSRLRNAV